MQPLTGKRAVVTGASRGLGLAIADALAAAGANVLLTGRDKEALSAAMQHVSRHNRGIESSQLDVRHWGAVSQWAQHVKGVFGNVDILVNNAGVAQPMHSVLDTPPEEWAKNIETNLSGTFFVTKALLPLMERGATIVNVASRVAYEAMANFAAYSASKAGVVQFSNCLREELRPTGIRVLTFSPGAVATDIWNQFWAEAPREKMMQPESIAQVLVSALSMPANTSVDEIRVTPTAGAL